MIAMARLTRPELLIADEPNHTALDVPQYKQILSLLRELQRELNMGLLFITHNLSIVKMADSVAVMQHGKCVENLNAPTSLLAPTHPYTAKTSQQRTHRRIRVPLPAGRRRCWKWTGCASPSNPQRHSAKRVGS